MRVTFEKDVFVCAPPATVFRHLAEPRNFVGLQPLLVELWERERSRDARGRPVRRFETVERLRLAGFVPWRNRIQGLLTVVEEGVAIDVEVHSRPGIVVHSGYRLAAEADGTRVAEAVAIDCPSLLARMVRREALRAHDHLLAALKKRLESGA